MCRFVSPLHLKLKERFLIPLDIVERFTLALMLFMIAIRNLIELSGTEFDFTGGFFFPKSFGLFSGGNMMYIISYVYYFYYIFSNNATHPQLTARLNRDGIRNARGLAETRFYSQVQSHSTICL